MGGAVLGFWGQSPQPPDANGGLEAKLPAPEAGGSGAKPQPPEARGPGGGAPSARKFCIFFCKNNFIFRAIFIK